MERSPHGGTAASSSLSRLLLAERATAGGEARGRLGRGSRQGAPCPVIARTAALRVALRALRAPPWSERARHLERGARAAGATPGGNARSRVDPGSSHRRSQYIRAPSATQSAPTSPDPRVRVYPPRSAPEPAARSSARGTLGPHRCT